MMRLPVSVKPILPLAARTASPDPSDDFDNQYYSGIRVVVDVTAINLTPSITVTIEGKDKLSGKYFTLLESAAITNTGTTVLLVYPGIVEAANLKASNVLGSVWRIRVTHGDGDSITYSVNSELLP